jgi:hypothetical protein
MAKLYPKRLGQWLHGNFSMTEYWAYDGSYVGNAFEQSIAFDFNADGSYEQYYAAQTNDWGCSTQAFSYSKGTVVFTDSSFTVYPTEGNFRVTIPAHRSIISIAMPIRAN